MREFGQVVALLNHLQRALGGGLTSFEVMWNDYYRLTTTPPAPNRAPLSQEYAYYVLIEALGGDAEHDDQRFARALDRAADSVLFADAVLAASATQRDELWRVREDSEQIERQHHLTFGYDVSLPIGAMEPYVATVRSDLERYFGQDARCWVYGHLGDGNLHINVWAPAGNAAVRKQVEEIVYRPLAALGGSVSAEHGIGLEKRKYLSWCRSEAELTLMRRLKAALDPTGILNPGRVLEQ